MKVRKNLSRGFTFIEIVIGTAIFLLFAVSIYRAYASLYMSISSARTKTLAVDLANEEFEIVKNLPYASVGTVGGTPVGLIPMSQSIVKDRINFVVDTVIVNKDDPFDGTAGGTPNDAFPADYKLVEFKVSCSSCKNFTPVIITGRVAPKNLETN